MAAVMADLPNVWTDVAWLADAHDGGGALH